MPAVSLFVALALPLLVPAAHAASIAAPSVIASPDGGAATADPAAIYYNPAAIGATEGFNLLLDGQLALINVAATATRNGGIDPNTGEPYATLEAHVPVPVGFLGATWTVIPKRLTFGLGVYDPFVGGGKYLTADGSPDLTASGRYHGISVEILTLAINPVVAVTPIDGFHIGVGGSYVIDHISALQAADPLGTEGIAPDELGSAPPANPYAYDVLLDAKASGGHFAWNAGIFIDRIKEAQVGLSFSSGAKFHATGDATVDIPAALSTSSEAATIPGKAEFTLHLAPIARVYVASQLSDTVRVGLGWDEELWNVCCGTADGDVHIGVTNVDGEAIGKADGSTLDIAKDQYNPSRLWNAASFSGNVGIQAMDPLWFGARVGYNQYATPSYSVNPVALDFDNVGVSVAARYRIGKALTLGLSYSHYFLMTREITDSAWNLQDGNQRFSPELPYSTSGNGTYSGSVNAVGLRVAAAF
jgi:long-chain fatty acid transport protein